MGSQKLGAYEVRYKWKIQNSITSSDLAGLRSKDKISLIPPTDRGSLPFEQNGPKEDIDDLRVVVRICPL